MTIEVTTKVVGQGKRHHVCFSLSNAETVIELLGTPTRPGARYRVIDGLVSGVAGSFFLAAGTASMGIVSQSVANPSVITVDAAHGQTGETFTVTLKGISGVTPTSANGKHTATVVSPTTFSIPINVTVAGTGNTGDCVIDPVSLSAILQGGVGIAFLGVAGATGQPISPIELPQDMKLYLASDTEATLLNGYLLVEEFYAIS